MKFSCRFVRFGRRVLLTDMNRHRKILPQIDGLEIEHTEESNIKKAPFPGHAPIAVDYDRDILRKTVDYCTTEFLLHIEHDSAILNPWAWDPEWLWYDFIGASWPPHHDPGWPPCNELNSVGNFGFCLGSRDFWRYCHDAYDEATGNPSLEAQRMSSDRFICRTMRNWMQDRGIKFATDYAASRFSCENMIYSGQFGYHGKNTAAMNNWDPNFIGK